METYVTTYCNHPHRVRDGTPIGHECYVIPPSALKAEIAGDTGKAIDILRAKQPLRRHAGARVTVNRWGRMLERGMHVTAHHPRGGTISGKITRIYNLPGYGKRIDFDSGGSVSIDDVIEE